MKNTAFFVKKLIFSVAKRNICIYIVYRLGVIRRFFRYKSKIMTDFMNIKTLKYFAGLLLLAAAGCSVVPPYARTRGCVEKHISNGVFDGAVVLAGDREGNLQIFTHGLADRNTRRPMTPDTVFDISSVSKPLGTATCALLLAERGVLDLDKDFRTYLPQYSGKAAYPVKVRHLASHYSGIEPNYPINANKDVLMEKMLASPFIHGTDKVYLYSCVNYNFLGFIIENVSKEPLAEFARKNLFEVLGMKDTRWGAPQEHTRDRLVVHSRCVKSDPAVIFDMWARKYQPRAMGNAGIFTTPLDVAKYARMILNGGKGVFKTNIVSKMMYQNLAPAGKLPRSFGWNLVPGLRADGLSDKTIYHSGSSGQSLWIDPGTGKFCLVFTNLFGKHDDGIRARREVASVFLAEIK